MSYLIMEKYGPSLKEILAKSIYGRFSQKTSVQIGTQLIDNFKELHDHGYVHSDLKLNNILLESGDRKS